MKKGKLLWSEDADTSLATACWVWAVLCGILALIHWLAPTLFLVVAAGIVCVPFWFVAKQPLTGRPWWQDYRS